MSNESKENSRKRSIERYMENIEEIKQLSALGYNPRQIHESLVKNNKTTMNYDSFYYFHFAYGEKIDPDCYDKDNMSKVMKEMMKNKNEIVYLLKKGYPALAIYEYLKDSGKFNFGQVSFYIYLKKMNIKVGFKKTIDPENINFSDWQHG